MKLKRNMILGNKYFLFLFFLLLFKSHILAEDKITSTPLINLEKIKPSFDQLNNSTEFSTIKKNIQEKKKKLKIL